MSNRDQRFLTIAINEAQRGREEGGIPIGAALVSDDKVLGRGRNRRVQQGSATLHAEIDCLENAGRLAAESYRSSTLYTTLSPCPMCTGAILLYQIPRVVVGENATFQGSEDLLRSAGVDVVLLDLPDCLALMRNFIAQHPDLWNEDIGLPSHPS